MANKTKRYILNIERDHFEFQWANKEQQQQKYGVPTVYVQ